MRLVWRKILVVFALFAATGMLCAWAADMPPPPGMKITGSSPGPKAAVDPTALKKAEEQYQALSTLPNILQHKDPFVRAPSPFKSPDAPVADVPTGDVNPNAPELERYPAPQYKVVATLLGDVYPRALVRAPSSKVFVVREKDKLGSRSGFIRRIQEGSLVVVETIKSAKKVLQVETRLSLDTGTGPGGSK